MKNYLKRLGMMLITTISIMLGCVNSALAADNFEIGTVNLNNTTENSAKIGNVLGHPEKGWKRFDDTNSSISYINFPDWGVRPTYYNSTLHGKYGGKIGDGFNFSFTGTKLRIISPIFDNCSSDMKVNIDGTEFNYSAVNSSVSAIQQVLVFEKNSLADKQHNVSVTNNQADVYVSLDAIDIDSTGELKPYNENIESISLDKPSMDLVVGDSHSLVATTTPAGAQLTWKSSDESVATVDQNGNVTAAREGNCIITATINDGSNLSDSCTINVTKKDTTEPTEPDNAKAILIINLTDGETKIFDVSYSEVSKFKQWYNTKSEFENKLTYEFNKTVNLNISIEEDVVHDQITSYEIRKY